MNRLLASCRSSRPGTSSDCSGNPFVHAGSEFSITELQRMAKAGAGEILVSEAVVMLSRSGGLSFEDRREHELKGLPDRWHLFRVVGPAG